MLTRRLVFGLLFSSLSLIAAPKLRLEATTVGPVSVAVGANATAQTVEAYNAGDGALGLRLTSSVTWLVPTAGASRTCSARAGACIPISIALQTASLARGIVTGVITVADPNAVDAPQTITVTVQAGGGVPDRLDFFVAPNGSSDEATFSTNSSLTLQSSQPWLSIALDGSGSFRFSYPYRVRVTHLPGMAEGSQTGSITTTGSTLAADNKTVPVSLRVTSQPIARLSDERLRVRIPQNSPRRTINVTATNRGLGALTVTGADATVTGGGTWLTAAASSASVVSFNIEVGSMAPGFYSGRVNVVSNAANSPVALPVDLEVVATGPPLSFFQGVVDNASFTAPVAPGSIVSIFGEQLSLTPITLGQAPPLATDVGGARAVVNNRAAPIYFVTPGQIAFQVPYETTAGAAEVRVEREGQRGNTVSVEIIPQAPRIVAIVGQDGAVLYNAGVSAGSARIGDALTIYAIGLGQTTPAAVTGAAAPSAEPLARVVPSPAVLFNGGFQGQQTVAEPLFAGLTPGFAGLYQVNAIIPPETTIAAAVPVFLELGGQFSNRVNIAIAAAE